MKTVELRDYQEKAIISLRHVLLGGKRKPVMVLPTGAGKSVIFGQIIFNALEKGNKILWLVHRRNLVFQMRDVLRDFGIEAGLIMAGVDSDVSNPVQLGTIQTYGRRLKLDVLSLNRFYIDADIVLIDEAHRSLSKTYREIIEIYSDKIIIGCTATPMRADQRGMGEVYDSIADIVGVKELTDAGFLSPARYFAPYTPDLSGVSIRMGDYATGELADKTNTKQLNGDIVDNWLRLAEGRKTIVFCVNVKHSIAVSKQFQKNGVAAEHLDARSGDDERDAVFARVESGETVVICNVGLYQEGLDVPSVSCVVMARPTKSLGLYRQCCGRGLRPSPGKEDCLIFDHGGVIEQNGFLDEPVVWSLDGKERAWSKPRKAKPKAKAKCTECGLVFEGANKCPDCGSPIMSFGKDIETSEAELNELNAKKNNRGMTWADKRRFMGGLHWYEKKKGWNPGRKAHLYRLYTSVWPNDSRVKAVPPIEPDPKTLGLIKHVLIKSAKQYQKNQRKGA